MDGTLSALIVICLCAGSSEVYGRKYEVTTYTANVNWAGTGSNVFIALYGDYGNSYLIKLPSTTSNFRVGGTDKFTVDTHKDLGDIYKIKVCQDWTGTIGPSWYLKKVTVIAEQASSISTFVINKWLEKNPPKSVCVIGHSIERKGNDCGKMPAKSRVVNGHTSKPNQWGWQVQLKIYNYGNHWCGGTLIHPNYVLTAAHCVKNVKPMFLIMTLGEHDITKSDGTEQVSDAEEVIIHPGYNTKTKENDFALIKLKKAAILNTAVRLACLPNLKQSLQVGQSCMITGWGKVQHPGGASNILQQAELPIVSNKQCNKLNGDIATVKDSMLCAGGNTKSGCHGDSGGPLVCLRSDGRYTVQGATSWGSSNCQTNGRYSVFARVSTALEWILSNIYSKYGSIYSQ